LRVQVESNRVIAVEAHGAVLTALPNGVTPDCVGVTLIETLVTALILAIPSSAALASYRHVLLRAHRGETHTARLQAAQKRHYLDHLHYLASSRPAPGGPHAADRPCAASGNNESGEKTSTCLER
jgi:Tfp pilus assembly protein PilE